MRARTPFLVLVLAITLLVGTSGQALAGTMDATLSGGTLTLTDAIGGQNQLAINDDGSGGITVVVTEIVQLTALIESTGGACTVNVGQSELTCPAAAGVTVVEVVAGAEADTVDGSTSPLPIHVNGGDGNDVVYGSPQADELRGGAGGDTLNGNGGADSVIAGGDGSDALSGGTGADTFTDTGTGLTDSDVVNYRFEGRGTGVTVTLDDVANDGETAGAENDNVPAAGIERVWLTENADSFTGGTGNDWVSAKEGDDVVAGGAGNDKLEGDAGGDQLTGNAGTDQLYGGDGDDAVLDGGDGSDSVWGGAGADAFTDTGVGVGDTDLLYYAFEGRVAGVTVTMDGTANDGTTGAGEGDNVPSAGFEQVLLTDYADVATGGPGNDAFHSKAGDDTVDGGAGDDLISASSGNDALTGGAGADDLRGSDGNDTLYADDGEVDTAITCDSVGNIAPGNADIARLDASGDPESEEWGCELAQRGPTESATTTVTMPGFEPYRVSGAWRYRQLRYLREWFEDRGINVRFQLHPKALRYVPLAYRASIRDGEVYDANPNTGPVTGSPDAPAVISVYYYDEMQDFSISQCPWATPDKISSLEHSIENLDLETALDKLGAWHCTYRIPRYFTTADVNEPTVWTATVQSQRVGTRRYIWMSLLVARPERPDFAINVTERPRQDWVDNPGMVSDLNREIGIGVDGKLTAGKHWSVISLTLAEASTGRVVRSAEVEVRGPDGKLIASQKTDNLGVRTFTIATPAAGTLRIDARVEGANGYRLESWATIPVVNRNRVAFYTLAGRYFRWNSTAGRYYQATPPATSPAAVNAVGQVMGQLTQQLSPALNSMSDAWAVFNANSGSMAAQLQAAAAEGVMPGKLLVGGTLDSTFNALAPTLQAGWEIQPDGSFVAVPKLAVAAPTVGDIATATLVGMDGATLIGMDGATLVGNNGNSLIDAGAPAAGLAANTFTPALADIAFAKGSALISDKGVGLVPAAGLGVLAAPSLVGNNGNTFVAVARP